MGRDTHQMVGLALDDACYGVRAISHCAEHMCVFESKSQLSSQGEFLPNFIFPNTSINMPVLPQISSMHVCAVEQRTL